MASFNGNLIPTALVVPEPTNPDFGQLTEPDYTLGWLGSTLIFGDDVDVLEIGQPGDAQQGVFLLSFGFLNWYNHIHVEPLSIDLGNLISVQEREVHVWNGYFVPRTLNDVVPANDDGLVLTEPGATPLVFAPLQQYDYELSISTDGPPVVDATYTFEFDVGTFVVSVTGVRIVAWQWEANWINPVIERLNWKTDVIEAYDGSEQRRALRGAPRAGWEFTFDVADGQRRLFENVLYSWGGRVWALPVWPDIQQLTDPLNSGSSTIPIDDTTGRDWHAEGLGVILGADGTYEAFEVDSVQPAGVTLSNPIANNWPAGSRVYPARTARMADPRATARFHRNYARGTARFDTVDEIEQQALSETLYRGMPVMEREPNWRDAPEIDYLRKLATLDFGYGKDVVTDESNLAAPKHAVRWTMLDRDEISYFRSWLWARQGRFKGVWVPTWSDDLVMVTDPLPADTVNIDVQACGLTFFAQEDVHRRDIRIELQDGSVFYRRVSGFNVIDAATERMTLNAALGVEITPEDVTRISWLHFVRMDSDSIELTWSTPVIAEAVLIFKGPRNDV